MKDSTTHRLLFSSLLLTCLLALSSLACAQTNSLAEARRFTRGAGSDQTFQSFVVPLDFEKGVELDQMGNSAAKFGNLLPAQLPWFTRIQKATAYHVSVTSNVATYPVSLKFENPLVAFGSLAGGTPLQVNQVYRFGFNAGGQLPGDSGDLLITVYRKADFSSGQLNVVPYGSAAFTLPRKNTADWDAFAASGYTQQVDVLLPGDSVPALKTTVQYVEGAVATDQWGSVVQAPLLLTHSATSDQYYYKVEYRGYTLVNAAAQWMAVTDPANSLNTSTNSIAYTLDFEQRPAWQSTFIHAPHFEAEPVPSAYDGKSLQELLNVSTPFVGTPSLAPTACLTRNASPELRIHPVLDRLVDDLKADPIALANYVFNEIALTDALSYNENGDVSEKSINLGGVNRSALATLQEGQGSPWEQCALLVYLLRKANVPAVYMEPEHNKLQMLDARMSTLLQMQIKGALDYKGSKYGPADPAQPTLIPVNYPWVAAYVQDANNPGQSKWVHLFPWLKDTEVIEGQNLYDYLPADYNSGSKWTKKFLQRDSQIFPADVDAFQQPNDTDGLVSIEAEHFLNKSDQGGHSWVTSADVGSSGSGSMTANANSGLTVDTGYTSGSPRLDYKVNFTKSGTHYVWLRGLGVGTADRTIHVGLDGAAISTADRLNGFTNTFAWSKNTLDGPVATITVTPGVHTINVWMREDGFVLDKLVITANSAYTPSGTGPTESTQNALLDDTPSNLFPQFVTKSLQTSAPGLTLDSIGSKARNRPNYRLRWEDFPAPFKLEGNPTTIESLQSRTNIFDTVSIEVFSNANPSKKVLTGDLRMSDIQNRKLLVRYDNAASNLLLYLAPYYSAVAGQGTFTLGASPDPDLLKKQVVSQALDNSDDALTVRVIHKRHRRLPTNFMIPAHWVPFLGLSEALLFSNDRPLRKGDLAAICFNSGQVTPKMLRTHAEEFWQMERTLAANPAATIDPEVSQGTAAYLMGMGYYERVSRFKAQCADLHKVNILSLYAVGLSKLTPKRVNDALPSGTLEMAQPSVDMFFYKAAHTSNATLHADSGNLFTPGTLDFWPVLITDISAQEHQIINSYYKDATAISTVKLLARAKDTTTAGILNLTKTNYVAQGNIVYAGAPSDVTWTNLVGTAATYPGAGSQLQKTLAGDAWNSADGVSSNSIAGDGFVQFRFGQNNKYVMLGLSTSNPNRDYTTVGYAIYGLANNTIQVYELGTQKGGTFPAYNTGDLFRIERTGSTIKYLKNGAVFYTSLVASSGSLIIDTAFYSSGAIINGCQYGESKPLKDWDASMWSGGTGPNVTNAMTGSDGDYVQVFMTPGPIASTSGAYRGMGAMIYGRGQLSALISGNMAPTNGGFGNNLNFSFNNDLPKLSLRVDTHNNYTMDFSTPTSSAPILAPFSFSHSSVSNVVNFATSNAYVYSGAQNLFTSTVSSSFGTTNNFATAITTSQNSGFFGTLATNVRNATEFVFDPVNAVTGEFYIDTVDLRLNGPMPLEIRRNYTSKNVGDNEFGYGWKMNYMPYLALKADNSIIYAAEPEGSVIAYRQQTDPNLWVPTVADNPRYSNMNHGMAGSSGNLMNGQIVKSTVGADMFYTLTGADGSVRTFKVQNFPIGGLTRSRPYLTKWQDHRGNFYVFSFGQDSTQTDYGELKRIDSSNGTFLGFYYDTFGHIVEAYTGDGRRLYYRYDPFGDLVGVTLPDATEWSYEYEKETTAVNGKNAISSKHLIVREIKPGGRILENTYDASRRVTQQKATVGLDMVPVVNATFDYSVANMTKVKDAYNRETTYEITNDLITKVSDPAPLNQFASTEWYTTTDAATGAYNRAVKKEIDKRGFITEYKYDLRGNLLESKTTGDITGDGVSETVVTGAAYNIRNLPTVIKDPANNSTAYFYDNTADLYLPTRIQKLNGGTLTGGVLTGATLVRDDHLDYYDVPATPVVNVASATGYNPFSKGLLQRKTVAFGTTDAAVVEWVHNATGFITTQTAFSGTADPNVVTTYVPNLRGEVVEQKDSAGRKIGYSYDGLGRRMWTEHRDEAGALVSWNYDYYNGTGEVEWSDGARYNPEDYVWRKYDGAGRALETIQWRSQPNGNGSGVGAPAGDELYATTFYKHDLFGDLTEVRDARHNSTTMGYDGIGQMTSRNFYEGDSATGILLATEGFDYEPGGQVKKYTNPLLGVAWKYYTANGKLRRQEDPDNSVLEWRYYADGRLQREILRNNSYWETVYDDVNRIVTRTLKTSGNVALGAESKTYDRRGNVVQESDRESNLFTKSYDKLDRPKTVTGPAATASSAQQTSTYTYDGSGKVLILTNALNESTTTTSDVLGRPVLVQTKNAGGTVVRQTSYAYSADHHAATVTEGSGATAIVNTNYTDTFGKTILNKHADGKYRLIYRDALGNPVWTQDEVGFATADAYDGFNRLKIEALQGGATTIFVRDAAGNLKERQMPSGLTWKATYDNASRQLTEELRNGSTVSRQFSYGYYPTGAAAAGLQQTVNDPRGITKTTSYDDFLRPQTITAAGAQPEQNQTTSYIYDKRDLLKQVTQNYANPSTGPPTLVDRTFDGYGHLATETVSVNGVAQSGITQSWDGAGRRSQRTGGALTSSFGHRADGVLTHVGVNGQNFDYGFGDNGLLTSRTVPGRAQAITQRDNRGRIQQESSTVGGSTPLAEGLTWFDHSKLNTYGATRTGTGAWNEATRYHNYNGRGNLTYESFSPGPGLYDEFNYSFDSGGAGVGVRTGAFRTGYYGSWWTPAGGLTALAQTTVELWDGSFRNLVAQGNAFGAQSVSLSLDGSLVTAPVTYAGWLGNGDWSATVPIFPGTHALTATAQHPSGHFQANALSNFTVGAATLQISSGNDAAGNLTTQAASGGNWTDTLTWDAAGRMVKVGRRTPQSDGYDWSAIYDGLGRRLRTTYTTVLANVPQAGSIQTDSTFDPQAEFLEIAASVNGQRTTKVYGPDLNGSEGGLQGVGGLEATIRESTGVTTTTVNDAFGNCVATATGGVVTWNRTRVNSYGPLPGVPTDAWNGTVSLAAATNWRGLRLDETGFYNVGARPYIPLSGRFAAPDPFGHGASMSLYDLANGDPINQLDPTGRIATSAAPQIKTNLGSFFGSVGGALQNAKESFSDFAVTLVTDPAKVGRGLQGLGNTAVSAGNTTLDYYRNFNGSQYVSDLQTGLGRVGENFNTQEKAFSSVGTLVGTGATFAVPAAAVSRPARIVGAVATVDTGVAPLLSETITGSGGRLGGTVTRALNANLAEQLIDEGYAITGGGGRAAEEFIRGTGGLSNTFVDITAVRGSSVIRIQTITTLADGVTPTASEAAAAARIRAAFPNDVLILIPKP